MSWADEWVWSYPNRVVPSFQDLRMMTRKDRSRFYSLIAGEAPLLDRMIALEHRMSLCNSFDSLEIYFAQHSHLTMFLRDHRQERLFLLRRYGLSHLYSE